LFLILDQQQTEFSLRLSSVAERKGLNTLLLTSAEIVRNLALHFYLSEQHVSLQLRYQDAIIESRDIDGVYCGINAFEPGLWPEFSPEDADFAARETQALWLAILASLPCRVVNPPALDTLAGTLLDTPEILYLAHQLGFQIPMTITLESGKVAAELLATGVPARYADLGAVWINEVPLSPVELSSLAHNEDHSRITEEMPGKPFYVTLVGNQFLASAVKEADGSVRPVAASQIPRPIKTRLRTLQKRLNLNLAEYQFRVTVNGGWVFSGCGRPPSFGAAAYGDDLFAQIVDYATGKGG
jgi:hypothetical protein